MYFKPRIFISSTIIDKSKLRESIKTHFESSGAEIALYEKDLTPSINNNTYRQDILQTDFAIFIIDERYGAETEFGISGTEEEFHILNSMKKPFHVYLKQTKKTKQAKKFENFIKSQNISYYYYKDEKDLKKKLFATCFTIAKDIIYYNIENQNIERRKIVKTALNSDYSQALLYCDTIERMLDISSNTPFTLANSNLIVIISDFLSYRIVNCKTRLFIDKQIDTLFGQVMQDINDLAEKISNESVPRTPYKSIPFNSRISTIELAYLNWNGPYDSNWYTNKISELLDNYNQFKQYIQQLKFDCDLI